jgi:O-antigen/teichoic acid export membrane protein
MSRAVAASDPPEDVATRHSTLVKPDSEGVDDLHRKVSSGLRWSFLNSIVARIGSVAFGIVMARLLVPEDFGVYAVALLVVNVLLGLNDLGLLLAVVRWPGELRVAAGTALTLATGSSLLLYGLVFVGAAPYAEFMGAPEATPLLRVLALTIVIDGLTTVPHGLLVRSFAQDRLARCEFAALPVGVTVGLLLALNGAGPWSLVAAYVVGNVVSALLMWIWAPLRVLPGFDMAAARWMLTYGGPLALTSLLEYVLLNADYLVVGRVLGPVALGLYLLAYNISNWPVAIITDAVRRVSIAGFSRLEDDEARLRASFRRTFTVMVSASLPLVIALAVLAEDLVGVLYGSKWLPAAGVLTWLAVLGGVRVAVGYVFDLLVGIGRTRLTLFLKGTWLVTLVPALIWAAETGGIQRVGLVHAAVGLLVVTPMFLTATRAVGVGPRTIAKDLARPLGAGAVAAAIGLAVVDAVPGGWARLLLVGPTILVVYAAIAVPWPAVARAARSRRNRQADERT